MSVDNCMSVDEMFLNLKILAQLQEYDKLISQEILEIDNRTLFQGLRRWYNEESREKTVKQIEIVFDHIFTYIEQEVRGVGQKTTSNELFDQDTYQLLQRFILDISNAIGGIENLRLTYREDITIRSKLTLLVDKLKIKTNRLQTIIIEKHNHT